MIARKEAGPGFLLYKDQISLDSISYLSLIRHGLLRLDRLSDVSVFWANAFRYLFPMVCLLFFSTFSWILRVGQSLSATWSQRLELLLELNFSTGHPFQLHSSLHSSSLPTSNLPDVLQFPWILEPLEFLPQLHGHSFDFYSSSHTRPSYSNLQTSRQSKRRLHLHELPRHRNRPMEEHSNQCALQVSSFFNISSP